LGALGNKDLENYWFDSSTSSYLVEQVIKHKYDIKSFTDGVISGKSEITNYRKGDPGLVPLLYLSGYLTIKGVSENEKLLLGFPNSEVKYAFYEQLYNYCFSEYDKLAVPINELSECLQKPVDLNKFVEKMDILLSGLPYGKHQKFEGFYQSLFQVILSLLGKDCRSEVHSSYGRADAVLFIDDFVFVFEFKMFQTDHDLDDALKQMEERGYLTPYRDGKLKLRKIAIVFDSATGHIKNWKIVED
jgi:hypothetical protein